MNKVFLPALIGLLCCDLLFAQTDYSNQQQLAQRVSALSESHPNLVKARSLVKTAGGADIWHLIIGTGNADLKPAIAIVGGVDGKHLLGVEMAIGFAEYLVRNAQNENVRKVLDRQTFYIFPNMSPDATEQYFASVRYERSGNARLVDYDRDGLVGEDGFDDLDNNGKITHMRVEDPTGTYVLNPHDPRSLVVADRNKGEIGQYLLLSEGVDNDKDGEINEDGNQGIHFNKNTTYRYRNFQAGAGEFAVSEPENRALFDLLYDSFNIYTVVTFGPHNNLSHPNSRSSQSQSSSPESTRNVRMMGGERISTWGPNDVQVNTYLSDRYKAITGAKDAPKTTTSNGDFSDWAYYHYGRLSFSTPGWWVPKVSENTSDSGRSSAAQAGNARLDDPIADYLKWADSESLTDVFSPWTSIDHPDFPGKKVEVGGVNPFMTSNPPYKYVGDIVTKHSEFVLELADAAPFIQLNDLKTEKLDNNLIRVAVKVFNSGQLPTLSAVGERSYFLKKIAVRLKLNNNQKLVSGNTVQTIGNIPGRGYVELSWLVQGSGKFTIEAGSPQTGSDRVEVAL